VCGSCHWTNEESWLKIHDIGEQIERPNTRNDPSELPQSDGAAGSADPSLGVLLVIWIT
jgi:hypothetical protein